MGRYMDGDKLTCPICNWQGARKGLKYKSMVGFLCPKCDSQLRTETTEKFCTPHWSILRFYDKVYGGLVERQRKPLAE